MKILTITLFLTFTINCFSQEVDLQLKMDSIIQEADLLFRYERAVWVSTDLLMSDKKLKKKFGGYVVYHSNDTTNVSMLDKNQTGVIARYEFVNPNFDSPSKTPIESSELTIIEHELIETKAKVIEQLSDSKYEVTIPQNYNPNLVLIKSEFGYKLYILMGTNENGIIPFGNDYLFKTDSVGMITTWQKFHSRMIPAQSEIPGVGKVTSSSHSHLRSTPYITATDICTFRLYAGFTELKEFSVYSPALGIYMKYNLEENKIEIEE